MSERQSDRPRGRGKRPAGGAPDDPVPEPGVPGPTESRPARPAQDQPSAVAATPRQKRIRRLKELVRDADYDVPSDEVAASIIRDALFGAPDPDEPR